MLQYQRARFLKYQRARFVKYQRARFLKYQRARFLKYQRARFLQYQRARCTHPYRRQSRDRPRDGASRDPPSTSPEEEVLGPVVHPAPGREHRAPTCPRPCIITDCPVPSLLVFTVQAAAVSVSKRNSWCPITDRMLTTKDACQNASWYFTGIGDRSINTTCTQLWQATDSLVWCDDTPADQPLLPADHTFVHATRFSSRQGVTRHELFMIAACLLRCRSKSR